MLTVMSEESTSTLQNLPGTSLSAPWSRSRMTSLSWKACRRWSPPSPTSHFSECCRQCSWPFWSVDWNGRPHLLGVSHCCHIAGPPGTCGGKRWAMWGLRKVATWKPRPADPCPLLCSPTQGAWTAQNKHLISQPPCRRAGPGVPSSANGVEGKNSRKTTGNSLNSQLTSVSCPPQIFPPKTTYGPRQIQKHNVRTRVAASRNREKEDITLGQRVRAGRGSCLCQLDGTAFSCRAVPFRRHIRLLFKPLLLGRQSYRAKSNSSWYCSSRLCAQGKH